MSNQDIIDVWNGWLWSPGWAQYVARRVRVGAKWAVREQEALDNWFRSKGQH